jgi:hypothetical protein
MKESTVILIVAVLLTILLLVLGGILLHNAHIEKMAELGYVEVSYPGSSWTHWEKVKK